jgi:hypothetical protein
VHRAGRYRFANLPPGNYRLAATDLVPEDLRDNAALEALAAQSTAVTLALGEQKTFDLRLGGR